MIFIKKIFIVHLSTFLLIILKLIFIYGFFLRQNGSDVNRQSYSGNTALHAACGRGQVEIVRLLLKSGADSSLKNYHNDTPVMVATNKKVRQAT